MSRRTHLVAVSCALDQELFEKGEELYSDENHRLVFQDIGKRYLGSVKRGERTIHHWWISVDEEMMTIADGPGGVKISRNIRNPLKKIPQREITIEELEKLGEIEIPPVMMRELNRLAGEGASVMMPLEYPASYVMLPLLGIKIVPESDAEKVKFKEVDWGLVRFYRSS